MKTLQLNIRSKKWRIYVLPDSIFDKHIGKREGAVTYPADRKIVFRAQHFNTVIVRHEIFHAYYAESLLSDSNLDAHQTEEATCELFANHGRQMDKDASIIFKWLKRNK